MASLILEIVAGAVFRPFVTTLACIAGRPLKPFESENASSVANKLFPLA
jgi:hypothetical protein